MSIFFTSDLHLGHSNILIYDKRPFATIEEHDETIIENWNKTVKSNDTVYFIGDFCLFRKIDKIRGYRSRLNGKIHLIYGNHDDVLRDNQIFESQSDMRYIFVGKQKIMLCHYPLLSWRSSNHGSFHLHGHCHSGKNDYAKRLEVSTNLHNYFPISFEFISEYMKGKENTFHHFEDKRR